MVNFPLNFCLKDAHFSQRGLYWFLYRSRFRNLFIFFGRFGTCRSMFLHLLWGPLCPVLKELNLSLLGRLLDLALEERYFFVENHLPRQAKGTSVSSKVCFTWLGWVIRLHWKGYEGQCLFHTEVVSVWDVLARDPHPDWDGVLLPLVKKVGLYLVCALNERVSLLLLSELNLFH